VYRALTPLPAEQQRQAWAEAVATAPDGRPTRKHVESVVRQFKERLGLSPSGRAPAPVESPANASTAAISETPHSALRTPHFDRSAATTEVNGLLFAARVPKTDATLKQEIQELIEFESPEAVEARNNERLQIIAENWAALELKGIPCHEVANRVHHGINEVKKQSAEYSERRKRRGLVRDKGKPLGQGNFKSVVSLLQKSAEGKAA
jgi:hypothetical protein